MPCVALATADYEYVAQIDPCLANQVRFLVIVEDGHLELVVVGTVVDCESELLVPAQATVC